MCLILSLSVRTAHSLWYNGSTDGALAEKLGNGLQNRVDGSVTRRCLQKLARMVELVDTRDLKSLGFTAVRVQVPLCAPQLKLALRGIFLLVNNFMDVFVERGDNHFFEPFILSTPSEVEW